jgi:beta-lactamase regulating signal transducer with metallopeptidase domain
MMPRTEGITAATPAEIEPVFENPQEWVTPPGPAVAPFASVRSQNVIDVIVSFLPATATLLWISGSVACAVVILLRIVRFHRLLRFATLAPPALQGRAAALARRMGMARAPRVWFVPGAVSPMLWPVGRSPRVLIPSELWDRLGEGQRSSLLAHELAHLRRRDHWVRLPEVLASVLYWWCPLMWYARRRLREAEEQCCDAWVVWALPDGARDYASALLTTVDFVTAAGGRAPLPVLASGMGQFHQLRRRLVMIKDARISRSLTGPGWMAVGALALVLLPIAPTLAQVSVSPATPADPNNPGSSDVTAALPPATVAPVAVSAPVPTTPPIVGASGSINATVTEVAPIAGGPAPAAPGERDASIINELKTKPVPKSASLWRNKSADDYASDDPRLDKARAEALNEVHDLSMKLKLAEQRLRDLEMAASKQMKDEAASRIYSGMPKGAAPGAPGAPTTPPMAPGYYPPKTNLENANGSSYGRTRLDRSASRESRLDAIEANLKALLDEVHSLREKPSSPPSSPETAPRFKEQAR